MFIFTLFHCDTFISCGSHGTTSVSWTGPGNSPGKLHHGLEPENDEFELGDNESYTALGGVSSVALTPGRQSRPESEAMSEWKTPVTPDTKEAEFQMYAKMYFSPTVTAKFWGPDA